MHRWMGGQVDGWTGGEEDRAGPAGDPRTCILSAGLPALLESSASGVSFSGSRVSFLTYKNLPSVTCACSSPNDQAKQSTVFRGGFGRTPGELRGQELHPAVPCISMCF